MADSSHRLGCLEVTRSFDQLYFYIPCHHELSYISTFSYRSTNADKEKVIDALVLLIEDKLNGSSPEWTSAIRGPYTRFLGESRICDYKCPILECDLRYYESSKLDIKIWTSNKNLRHE